jgi:hypothetical protein
MIQSVIWLIDTDVANDPCSTANTAVPAEFAGCLVAQRFIGNAGHNKPTWNANIRSYCTKSASGWVTGSIGFSWHGVFRRNIRRNLLQLGCRFRLLFVLENPYNRIYIMVSLPTVTAASGCK